MWPHLVLENYSAVIFPTKSYQVVVHNASFAGEIAYKNVAVAKWNETCYYEHKLLTYSAIMQTMTVRSDTLTKSFFAYYLLGWGFACVDNT